MHVLLVCNNMALGGAERYLIDLANSLIERDIQVTMAFGGPVLHEPGPVEQVQHLEVNRCTRFGKLGPFRLIVDLPIGKQFFDYIRKENVDIVNSVMLDTGIWGVLVGRLLKIPVIHTPMHVFLDYSRPERFLIGSKIGAKIVRFLGLNFIVVSDYYAWELVNIGKVPASRIHTAGLGIDLQKFRPKTADDSIRQELGLRDDPVIGIIGRLYRVKGQHKILTAMPSVLRICPEAKLLFVGDGPERENLERQAKDLQVQDSVIFAGWRTDTAEMTALMDVYIQTGDGPNLGISALQALSQAKPLVVFASDELEEKMAKDTVQDGINGYIVPTNEPDKAGETIGKMLNDTQRLKEMGLASRKIAEERFDWRSHVSKVIEIYQKLKDRS